MRKIMKYVALCCVALLAVSMLAGCQQAAQQTDGSGAKQLTKTAGKLTIGMEVGYPPMEYTTDDGKDFIGFDVDVAKALGEVLGLKVEFINTSWDGIFAGLEKNQYDAIISAVSITTDRQEKYLLTEPYVANRLCVVTKGALITPESFAGKKIAVQDATTASDSIQELVDAGIKIEVLRYEKVTQCFDDLKLGRVDAVYVDSVVAAYYTKDNDAYKRVWNSEEPEPMGICLSKNATELAAAIEAAIDTLYYTGEMGKIAEKHFGEDFTKGLRVVTEKPVINLGDK